MIDLHATLALCSASCMCVDTAAAFWLQLHACSHKRAGCRLRGTCICFLNRAIRNLEIPIGEYVAGSGSKLGTSHVCVIGGGIVT